MTLAINDIQHSGTQYTSIESYNAECRYPEFCNRLQAAMLSVIMLIIIMPSAVLPIIQRLQAYLILWSSKRVCLFLSVTTT
jgi:hypothetical protein